MYINNIQNHKFFQPFVFGIAFLAVFSLGLWIGDTQLAYRVAQPNNLDFSLFWDAYNKLEQNFISPDRIDNQKVVYGAISGMTQSLGDPYTAFFDPNDAKRFEQDLSGSFEGIGVEIGLKKNQLTVIAPLPKTPGERAGLKPGDIIAEIDGKATNGMSTDEAVTLIRGQKGTDVTLAIYREGWQNTKDFVITRGTIKIPSMEWSLKNGKIAYIHIFQFDEALSSDFKQAALEILVSPANRIVLDLRNNPGGYLEVAQDIAGWFLKPGQLVTVEDFGGNQASKNYKAQGNSDFFEYPVVVLINGGSASASEILAGCLKDNRGIKLIGEKSFGKGSVQQVINLPDGSFLKVTIAKWLTPKGVSISEVGLTPDIAVEITDQQFQDDIDPQLDKALEIIKTLQ